MGDAPMSVTFNGIMRGRVWAFTFISNVNSLNMRAIIHYFHSTGRVTLTRASPYYNNIVYGIASQYSSLLCLRYKHEFGMSSHHVTKKILSSPYPFSLSLAPYLEKINSTPFCMIDVQIWHILSTLKYCDCCNKTTFFFNDISLMTIMYN